MELICPAGTPAAFREAVDAGADAVYCGFRDETNARNFPASISAGTNCTTQLSMPQERLHDICRPQHLHAGWRRRDLV